jgi:6-phosphogluconolactonase
MRKINKKVFVFENIEELTDFAVKKWMNVGETSIKRDGRFTVALSGGNTPVPLYNSLALHGRNLPWDKTHIFLVDERFVPHGDPASNIGMIKKQLLEKINIPGSNIHPAYFAGTVKNAAKIYEESIKNFFKLKEGQTPQFDLIMLGVGEDGHTASLFPNHEALSENKRLASAVLSPGVKNARISITFPLINNAKNIVFVITEKSKAAVVEEIIEKKNRDLPASLVNPDKGELLYLMHKQAASGII